MAAAGLLWKWTELPLPACVWKGTSGLPCPTCGMSRGFDLLLAGNFAAAFMLNPLTLLLPAALAGLWVIFLLRVNGWLPARLSAPRTRKISNALRLGFVFLLAAVWVYLLAAH
jgi:hypothetical protein